MSDGRTKLTLTRREFGVLNNSFIEVRLAFGGSEEFLDGIGLSEEQAGSLFDEFLLLRYEKFGEPRPIDPQTDRPWWSATEPRRTGTDWDQLPRMEGDLLADSRVVLRLARGALKLFQNLLRSMLDALR